MKEVSIYPLVLGDRFSFFSKMASFDLGDLLQAKLRVIAKL